MLFITLWVLVTLAVIIDIWFEIKYWNNDYNRNKVIVQTITSLFISICFFISAFTFSCIPVISSIVGFINLIVFFHNYNKLKKVL